MTIDMMLQNQWLENEAKHVLEVRDIPISVLCMCKAAFIHR